MADPFLVKFQFIAVVNGIGARIAIYAEVQDNGFITLIQFCLDIGRECIVSEIFASRFWLRLAKARIS